VDIGQKVKGIGEKRVPRWNEERKNVKGGEERNWIRRRWS
jgi:hypothetical protein